MYLQPSCKIVQAINVTAGAAAAANVNGDIIDMQGYDSVLFVAQFGPIVGGAVTSLKVQQGDDPAMADAADLLGTGVTVLDTDDNKVKYIEVYRPKERYVRLVCLRATQAATVAAMAYLHAARSEPVSQPADVAGESHLSPAEGAA